MKGLAVIVVVLLTAGLGGGCRDGNTKAERGGGKTSSPQASQLTQDLDRLLAPVALYPDALLAQMLLCMSDPKRVVELHTWLSDDKGLKGTALQDAATMAGFEPSFVALTLFPDVVKFMADRPDWMAVLGKTFTADRTAVFDGIQRLRALAQASGALKSTPQQDVETRTTSKGQDVIVIEPANPQVVYVPQYDPQVVYTAPASQTIVVEDNDDGAEVAAAGLIGFAAGVAIGAAFDNDYYYARPYGWYGGAYMYNDAWDDWYDARDDLRDDYVDHRDELRDDWADNRQDMVDHRADNRQDVIGQRDERARNVQEQRTGRQQTRQDTRTGAQAQRTERQDARQGTGKTTRPQAQAQKTQRQQTRQAAATTGTKPRSKSTATTGTTGTKPRPKSTATTGPATRARTTPSSADPSRGYGGARASTARSGASSDAFSGYSRGGSERAASSRGHASRSSSARSRGGGGGRRR
jgi:hypothetical protein